MKASLLRTSSFTSCSIIPSSQNGTTLSPSVSFGSKQSPCTGLRRSCSDTDMVRLESKARPTHVARVASVSFPDLGVIFEEDRESEFVGSGGSYWQLESGGIGFGNNGKGNKNNGGGKGRNNGNSNSSNDNDIGEYYKKMLRANPGDSLLLRNYAKYLHEVEKNVEKAEEYYGRAILANPGDGELLSLYGNLIWETQKDEDRARSYLDQAVQASPNDCMVLGSYAHFLWEADEDEEEVSQEISKTAAPAMVGAY